MAPFDIDEKIAREIIGFQHKEIRRRYSDSEILAVANQAMKEKLVDVPREEIEQLEEMFISVIYPSPEMRSKRDKSFASLVKLLKDPAKLSRMIPSIPKIMFRFGRRFPTALRVGIDSMAAYMLSMSIESRQSRFLIERLKGRGVEVGEHYRLSASDYKVIYQQIPYRDFKKLIGLAKRIAETAKTPDIMYAAHEIMNDVRDHMIHIDRARAEKGREPNYEEDIWSISFGLSMLEKVLDVFKNIQDENVPLLLRLMERIETNYLDSMYQGADHAGNPALLS